MDDHRHFMRRCFDLARMGAQTVSPNPVVGAVIVHNDRIIGEGFHQKRGEAHAEVRAIESVGQLDRKLLPNSTIYVSLEPCSHHGLTPPCSDLIIASGFRRVVISVTDPNPLVSGAGIARMRKAGIEVTTGVLEREGEQLLSYFRSAMVGKRPYVIVKFVQSKDGYIGLADRQVWLSNSYEKVLVHKLRSEMDAIMVGTNTAVIDNPKLTTRDYFGPHPLRVIVDRTMRIPNSHALIEDNHKTVFYSEEEAVVDGCEVVTLEFGDDLLNNILSDLYLRSIQCLMVEGGASLIDSFVEKELWDEAWVVTSERDLSTGIKAPVIHGKLICRAKIGGDTLNVLRRRNDGI